MKKIIFASLAAVLLAFAVFWLPVAIADNSGTERLEGVVRILVVEAIKDTPSIQRLFVERCGGAACDYTNLKPGTQIDHVYLNADEDIDLQTLIHKKVILRGRASDPVSGQDIKSFNQQFSVTAVERVEVLPQAAPADVQVAPITLPPPSNFTKNVVVLPTSLSTNPTMPYTEAQFRQLVFGEGVSVRKHFEANSFHSSARQGLTIKGANNPAGDVAANYIINGGPTNCLANMANPWRIERDNAATSQGFPILPGQTRIHAYANIPGCAVATGTVGIFGNTGITNYVFITLPASGTQADLDVLLSVLVHEMEHNLGQGSHASGQQVEGGSINEYADRADPLGNPFPSPFNNNAYRLKFGWYVNHKILPALQYRGTYRFKLQTPAAFTKGIGPNSPPMGAFVVLRDMSGNATGSVDMFEAARTQRGIWEQFTAENQPYANGLAIRRIATNFESSNTGSVIQDTTPGTVCCKDAPLVPGQSGSATWSSTLYGYSVTAFTATRYGMWVEVTLGNNYPLPPS